MSHDAPIWNDVVSAQKNKTSLSDEWYRDFYNLLRTIRSEEAQILYTDLCKVQLALDGELKPKLHFLESIVNVENLEDLRHFCAIIIDNGKIVDTVADCVELAPEARARKWKQEATAWNNDAALHRRYSDLHTKFSAFVLRSREEHAQAYMLVRTNLQQSTLADASLSPFEKIILYTPERLGRMDRQFWNEFQLSRLSIPQKKAVCHKLKLCQPFSTCPALIHQHQTALTQSLFVEDEEIGSTMPRCMCAWSLLRRIRQKHT